MYLLLLFASLGTLYEPSSGTQILTIVYNDTLFFFFFFFVISNVVCHQVNRKGDYFKQLALKQLKPVSIGFALVIKNYSLFLPNFKR